MTALRQRDRVIYLMTHSQEVAMSGSKLRQFVSRAQALNSDTVPYTADHSLVLEHTGP